MGKRKRVHVSLSANAALYSSHDTCGPTKTPQQHLPPSQINRCPHSEQMVRFGQMVERRGRKVRSGNCVCECVCEHRRICYVKGHVYLTRFTVVIPGTVEYL